MTRHQMQERARSSRCKPTLSVDKSNNPQNLLFHTFSDSSRWNEMPQIFVTFNLQLILSA